MIKARITKLNNYTRKHEWYSSMWFRYHKLFFGSVIKRGRKIWAFNLMCDIRYSIKSIELIDPFRLFLVCMMKITPSVILFPLKLGGLVHGVPMPISERKRYTFAVKWVVKALKDKNRKFSVNNISEALTSALYGKGISMDIKDSVNRTADYNRYLVSFLLRY